ncbi:MAG: DUF1329 domain-containing protein [Deltaproteobacteria bacterium]|nr:DUF1329 domain-containing protein [Deltaproteobacteria bacterium]
MRVPRWSSLLSGAFLCWSCGAGRTAPLPSLGRAAETRPPVWVASGQTLEKAPPFAEQVLRGFFPYRQGPPRIAGIAPGVALSLDNWQLARAVLPPEILGAVRDGELSILVQDTSDLPVSPEYMTATIEHAQNVSLDETGNLVQYRAGLPFPLLDQADPRAGLKAAWNARYADSGDSVQRWESLQVKNNAGEYQYGFSFLYTCAYGMHRAKAERDIAEWAQEGILYKEFMQVLHPGPSLTIHPQLGLVHMRYWPDEDTRTVLQWYITGYPEAINRLRTLVYNPESSAWRFPLLYEDLVGTYVHAYHWRLVDTRVALVPGFVQGVTPLFGGRRAGYPLDPWELRTVHVVEAIPRHAEHPYGRKVFFLDQQTFAPLLVIIYDRQGKPWRIGFFSYAHPDAYPGGRDVRVPILIGRSWIDYTVDRATLALVDEAIYNKPLPPEFFTRANMVRKGK